MTVYICKALRNLIAHDEADSDVAATNDQVGKDLLSVAD